MGLFLQYCFSVLFFASIVSVFILLRSEKEGGRKNTELCARCKLDRPEQSFKNCWRFPAEIIWYSLAWFSFFGNIVPDHVYEAGRYCDSCRWKVNLALSIIATFLVSLLIFFISSVMIGVVAEL